MTLAPANPDHLTQRELEQALWAAANALRGPVDPGDFKAYVFPVLFYKWISDVYDYHHAQATSDLGDDWTQEIEDEDYQTFLIPDGAHWDDTYEVTKNPGATLNKALVAIQEANPGKLAGVFGDVNWANTERIPESALKALMGVFDRLTLDPAHMAGDILGSASASSWSSPPPGAASISTTRRASTRSSSPQATRAPRSSRSRSSTRIASTADSWTSRPLRTEDWPNAPGSGRTLRKCSAAAASISWLGSTRWPPRTASRWASPRPRPWSCCRTRRMPARSMWSRSTGRW